MTAGICLNFWVLLFLKQMLLNFLELGTIFYVVFAWCAHNAAHFVCNSISGLTPFTYFRIIVSLKVTVGVSSHKFEVGDPLFVMSSFGLFSFSGRPHF